MTNPAAQLVNDLRHLTDPQAQELYTVMMQEGKLPPPPELTTLSTAQLAQRYEQLRAALLTEALAWGQISPSKSDSMNFANGLLYVGCMLDSCNRLDTDPLIVLTVFTAWGATFVRDILHASGYSEEDAQGTLDRLAESNSLQVASLLETLPDMARGGLMAALCAFDAGAAALVPSTTEDTFHGLMVAAGQLVMMNEAQEVGQCAPNLQA